MPVLKCTFLIAIGLTLEKKSNLKLQWIYHYMNEKAFAFTSSSVDFVFVESILHLKTLYTIGYYSK